MARLETSRWPACSPIPRWSWLAAEVDDVEVAGVDLGTETEAFRVRTTRGTKGKRKKAKGGCGGVHDGRGSSFLPAAMAMRRG